MLLERWPSILGFGIRGDPVLALDTWLTGVVDHLLLRCDRGCALGRAGGLGLHDRPSAVRVTHVHEHLHVAIDVVHAHVRVSFEHRRSWERRRSWKVTRSPALELLEDAQAHIGDCDGSFVDNMGEHLIGSQRDQPRIPYPAPRYRERPGCSAYRMVKSTPTAA